MNYIKLLRLKHWIKNLLIFLPLICAGSMFHTKLLLKVLLGTGAFCCLSSAVYVMNDICDREKDRLHDTKKHRPIASGAVSVKSGIAVVCIILGLAVLLQFFCVGLLLEAWLVFAGYFLINFGYSILGWKKLPLLDIVLLASGFFLRVLYGAVITDIQMSAWLYLVIVAGAFYMGFGKRRNELLMQSGTRDVLKEYSTGYLDREMVCAQTLSIIFYALWCLEKNENSVGGYLWTIPVLMLIFFRYGMDIEKNSDGDPVNVILKDKWLIGLCFILVMMLFILIYRSYLPL